MDQSTRRDCVRRASTYAWAMALLSLGGCLVGGGIVFPLLMAVKFSFVGNGPAAAVPFVLLYAIIGYGLRKRSRTAGSIGIGISLLSLAFGLYCVVFPLLVAKGVAIYSSEFLIAVTYMLYPIFVAFGSLKLLLDVTMVYLILVGWRELR